VGLNINIAKTREMRIMTANSNSLYRNDSLIERLNQFTYLRSTIDESSGTETETATRVHKAHMAFGALKIWNSRAYSIGTKRRLFNSTNQMS
jgi:hypothetical protein